MRRSTLIRWAIGTVCTISLATVCTRPDLDPGRGAPPDTAAADVAALPGFCKRVDRKDDPRCQAPTPRAPTATANAIATATGTVPVPPGTATLRTTSTPQPPVTPDPATATPTVAPLATATPLPDPCLGAPAYPERIPANEPYNRASASWQPWRSEWPWVEMRPYYARLDAACHGSTEQVLEWAARKWIPETVVLAEGSRLDLMKAVAVRESSWRQDGQGDFQEDRYCRWQVFWPTAPAACFPIDEQSYGITQVKRTLWPGAWGPTLAAGPAKDSTAWAADYYGMHWRHCYDGAGWWGAQSAGNVWGCVSAWFQGSDLNPSSVYAEAVKAHLRNRTWGGY